MTNKIEAEMLTAIRERRNWRCDNTEVIHNKIGTVVLPNNIAILHCYEGKWMWTLAGRNNHTVRSRINAVAAEYGFARVRYDDDGTYASKGGVLTEINPYKWIDD